MVKHIDSLHDREITAATQTPDKGILTAGSWGSTQMFYYPPGRRYRADTVKLFLTKYDSVGNILWEKTYFPTLMTPGSTLMHYVTTPLKLAIAADSGILLSAFGDGPYNTYGHVFFKFDSEGNFLWSKRYPYSALFNFLDYVDLIPLADGGYYFSYFGNTNPITSNIATSNAVYAYGRADAQGNTRWLKYNADTIPGTNGAYYLSLPATMALGKNNDLMIIGQVEDSSFLFNPTLLVTDSNGRVRYKRKYAPFKKPGVAMYLNHAKPTPYNTLVCFGVVECQNALIPGVMDTLGMYGWLMQTDSFGCMQPGCETGDTVWHYSPQSVAQADLETGFFLYPNPATDNVVLENVNIGSNYFLTDMKGVLVGQGKITEKSMHINVSALVPGAYILQVTTDSKTIGRVRLIKR